MVHRYEIWPIILSGILSMTIFDPHSGNSWIHVFFRLNRFSFWSSTLSKYSEGFIYPFHRLLLWSQLLSCFSGMLDLILVLRLSLKFSMRAFFFVVNDEGVSQLINRLKFMPLLVLSSKLYMSSGHTYKALSLLCSAHVY